MISQTPDPAPAGPPPSPADRKSYRAFLREELSAAARYQMMARLDTDPVRKAAFGQMAAVEMKHAAHWATMLGLDASRLRPARVGGGLIVLGLLARVFGPARLIPLLLRGESAGARTYAAVPAGRHLVADEREHQKTLREMAVGPAQPDSPHPEPGGFLRGEGGTLRAAVLGVNDGLVSNFSLVMGVAGGTGDTQFIILAGVAGLLAGAFSMAAGEYISMRSQRDVYEHLIATERAEIEHWPEDEEKELSYIYQRKGLTPQEADLVAARLMQNKDVALETKAREELGLDPKDLGAPWGAALSSMLAFVAGAIFPLVPFLVGAEGTAAVIASAALSGGALIAVGLGLAWISGVSGYWAAGRMLLFGGAAASVTYGVGRLIGVSVN